MKKKNCKRVLSGMLAVATAICLLLSVAGPLSASAAYIDSGDDTLLLAVESIYEWNEGYAEPSALTVKSENAPDGANYVGMTVTGGVGMMSRAFTAVDLSAYSNGYFHLFLYVSDASKLTGGEIELTSGGNADTNEMNWSVTSLGLQNGWNELYLPVTEAGSQGGTANLSSINYFRVFFLTSGDIEVGIDHMSMTKVKIVPADDKVIIAGEAAGEWNEAANLTEVSSKVPVGQKYVTGTAADVFMFSRLFDAVDLTMYKKGYIHLFLYVEDASKLTGGQIELTSGSNADTNEMNWEVTSLGLQSGWNEVYLPVASAGSQNGTANLAAINYFRIYFLYSGTMTVGIDQISATQTQKDPIQLPSDEQEQPEVIPEADDKLLLAVDNIYEWNEGFTEPPMISAMNGGYEKGIWVSATADNVAMLSRRFDAVDLTLYKKGYIHLFLYVEDASKLTGGQIELTSSGNADSAEMNWEITSLGLKNGWNEVYLSVADAGSQGGTADLSAINYMRVFFLYSGTNTVGVDHITATQTQKDPATLPGQETDEEIKPDDETKPSIKNTVLLKVDNIYEWNEGLVEPPRISAGQGGPDGDGYVYTNTDSVSMFSRAFAPVDLTAYADGYIHLFLYVEDASKLTGGQIELTSSGDADSAEMNWNIMSLGLKDGWNEVYLSVASAGSQNGTADLSAINYLRVYFLYDGTMTTGIDDIVATANQYELGKWYENNPQTGDSVLSVLSVLMLSGAAVAVVCSKRKYFI